MAPSSPSPHRARTAALAAALAALPAIVFFALLARFCVNLPMWDDYDAGLAYLDHLVQLPSASARWLYFLSAQHNEYKLYFVNGLVWLQFHLQHRLDFQRSGNLSNLLILPMLVVLWKLCLPACTDPVRKLLLLVPASYLLFQLNYAETLDWAISNEQTLPVLSGCFGAICLLVAGSRRAFWGSLLCLLVALASSGNGFLLIPLGALILLQQRRWRRLALWCLVTALCAAVYAWHYVPLPHDRPVPHSLVVQLAIKPFFAISFLGNLVPLPFKFGALVPGLALIAFWLWMARRGYLRRNPAIACSVLFIVLTACLVAAGRSDLGFWASVSSRYRLYPDLLVIFAWSALAEEFLEPTPTPAPAALLRSPLYLSALTLSILFALCLDAWGCRFLAQRDRFLRDGMHAFEHPQPADPTLGPVLSTPDADATMLVFEARARRELQRSLELGTYRPPPL